MSCVCAPVVGHLRVTQLSGYYGETVVNKTVCIHIFRSDKFCFLVSIGTGMKTTENRSAQGKYELQEEVAVGCKTIAKRKQEGV
jgi:hypothetical protein